MSVRRWCFTGDVYTCVTVCTCLCGVQAAGGLQVVCGLYKECGDCSVQLRPSERRIRSPEGLHTGGTTPSTPSIYITQYIYAVQEGLCTQRTVIIHVH